MILLLFITDSLLLLLFRSMRTMNTMFGGQRPLDNNRNQPCTKLLFSNLQTGVVYCFELFRSQFEQRRSTHCNLQSTASQNTSSLVFGKLIRNSNQLGCTFSSGHRITSNSIASSWATHLFK